MQSAVDAFENCFTHVFAHPDASFKVCFSDVEIMVSIVVDLAFFCYNLRIYLVLK